MRITKLIAVGLCTVAAAVAVPATASASIGKELKAAGWVERDATSYYPRYDFTASCDQYSRTRFWCTVVGSSGDCYRTGHASVHLTRWHWWVTVRRLERQCY